MVEQVTFSKAAGDGFAFNQSGGHGSPPCLVLEKQQLELPRSSGSCANETTVSLKTNRASMGALPACVFVFFQQLELPRSSGRLAINHPAAQWELALL